MFCRTEEGVREHGRLHYQQDSITESCFNKVDPEEPGTEADIASFCELNFGVTFPLFAKVDVNGDDASPLFDWMKSEAKGLMGSTSIKWNFTKFLIDREGNVVKRYGPQDTPASIAKDIAMLL